MDTQPDPNQFSHAAWEGNAEVWDARMGDEGNDFFSVLCWPAIASFLAAKPGQHILDVACGNGLTSRRLPSIFLPVSSKKPKRVPPITSTQLLIT